MDTNIKLDTAAIAELLQDYTTPQICALIKEGNNEATFADSSPIRLLVEKIFFKYNPIVLMCTLNFLGMELVRRVETYGWLDED